MIQIIIQENISIQETSMAKKHDESGALKSFARVGKIDAHSKTLTLPKGASVGIKTWGKIDFLTNYCGWTLKVKD